MIQPRRRLRLAQEPPPALGAGHDPDPRQLERHPALQQRVFGQVNHAEAAATQLALDRKTAELPGYSLSIRIVARPDLIEQMHHVLDVEIARRFDRVVIRVIVDVDAVGRQRGVLVGQVRGSVRRQWLIANHGLDQVPSVSDPAPASRACGPPRR